MAATFEWNEDHGAQTGSPLKGTTRSTAVTEVNWKNVDDSTTAYSSSPIVAGNNSFSKYQFGKFTGTFNNVLNGLYSAHTAGTSPMGTGFTLKGTCSTTYATPATSTNAALTTDFSSTVAIGAGLTVLFHTTGPEGASPGATLSASGYSQYLITQLQTTSSAAAGDSPTITSTLQYDEN
jgi:hypothetical protein